MTPPHEPFADRRDRLVAQIARQRAELAFAYRNLEKPIHYAEYGLRGFGFLRKNSWVFMALPATLSIASTLFGLRKKKPTRSVFRQRQRMEERPPKGILGHAVRLGGHGFRLFKLYRKVRPFLPIP